MKSRCYALLIVPLLALHIIRTVFPLRVRVISRGNTCFGKPCIRLPRPGRGTSFDFQPAQDLVGQFHLYHIILTQGIHLLFGFSSAMDCKSILDTSLRIYLIVWDSLLLLRRCGLPRASRLLLPWCFTRRWITQIFEKAILPWRLDA